MKTAVVLRHAERQDRSNNQSHLSQEGIAQARQAAVAFARFDLVVTSPLPRAFETAIAMGFAVSRTHASLQDIGDLILRQVNWDAGYRAWAKAARSTPAVKAYVDYLGSLLGGWLEDVPGGGSLLVVAHGGSVEAMAAALCPEADWAAPGASAGYAEGFTAAIEEGGGHELAPFPR